MKKPELTKQEMFIKEHKRHHHIVCSWRIILFAGFLFLWELSSRLGWIDSFFFSSPSRVALCFFKQSRENLLFIHMGITLWETVFSFLLVFLGNL